MPNPFFSGRIPEDLLDHVEKHRESTGESKTDILVKALAAYTGFKVDSKTNVSTHIQELTAVFERLERLESHVFGIKVKPEISEIDKRQYSLLDQVINTEEAKILQTKDAAQVISIESKDLRDLKKKGLPQIVNGYHIDLCSDSETEEYWKKNIKTGAGRPPTCWKITPM